MGQVSLAVAVVLQQLCEVQVLGAVALVELVLVAAVWGWHSSKLAWLELELDQFELLRRECLLVLPEPEGAGFGCAEVFRGILDSKRGVLGGSWGTLPEPVFSVLVERCRSR